MSIDAQVGTQQDTEIVQQGVGTDFSHGFYGEVELTGDGTYLTKVYDEKSGIHTIEDANTLAGHMNRFDDITQELGLPVVRAADFRVEERQGKVRLLEVTPNVSRSPKGSDLQHIFNSGAMAGQEAHLIGEMLQYHRAAAGAGFPVTFDAVLANFVLGQDNLYYVDKMPPRQRLEDGSYLSEIPVPEDPYARGLVERRHFTDEQYRVIYTQLLRGCAGERMLGTAPQLKELMGLHLGDEAYNKITVPPDELERITAEPQFEDIDTIRMLGWEQLHHGLLVPEEAKAIHAVTHIHYGGILPQPQELQQAASLLRVG